MNPKKEVGVQTPDLNQLGQLLEGKRRGLGIARTVIARKIGISTSYAWMIERARGHKEAKPYVPSSELLDRWGGELLLTPQEQRRVRVLAGYEQNISNLNEPTRETIIENVDSIISNPTLTPVQRLDAIKVLHSFTSWLKDQYRL